MSGIPDGTSCVCVTLGRMPQLETDAGQKGAVVYRYVLSLPALPSSPHRPPDGRRAPSRVSRCMADQNVTAEEKGGQVDCGRRWVRAQQAVRRGCAFPCDLFFFLPSCTRCCVACAWKKQKTKKQSTPPLRAMQTTEEHKAKRHSQDNKVCKQVAELPPHSCHSWPLRSPCL